MEFDKSKILTVVTADQAIACKKGWFSNDIPSLKIYVERGDEPKGLQSVDFHNEYPFRESYPSDGSFACKYRYFYPAPEPTYAERQAEWVKENNVKVGTKVRVTRTFVEDEDGSCCFAHDDLVGENGIVQAINPSNLGINMNEGYYKAVPYFALEVIKEPTYRPFKNAEEFKPYRDEWFVSKCDNSKSSSVKALSYSDLGVILLREVTKSEDVVFDLCKWDEFFQWFTRENGEPCGVMEEV